MVEKAEPLLTYICSISTQSVDAEGSVKTFSIHVGDTGGFSSNVLRYMPISKRAGKYLMTFDPTNRSLTIKKPE